MTSKNNTVTFQKCLKVTLFIGQCFALLPVFGITGNNVLNVNYKQNSWKYFYTVVIICCQIFMTAMSIYNVYNYTNLGSGAAIVFYGTTCITTSIFLRIAKSWPRLVRYIANLEELDPSFDGKLANKCVATCVVLLCLALFEHILALLPDIYGAKACLNPPIDTYEKFLKDKYDWIFILVPYHLLLGVLFQFLQIQATFTWNFSDLFVICMSYYLTSRLQLVNEKLRSAHGKPLPESFWQSTREKYGRATQLVRKVDKVISGLVFMSFANNLFFICLQLFFTLENGVQGENKCINHPNSGSMVDYITGVYFLYSLMNFVSRGIAVSLIASRPILHPLSQYFALTQAKCSGPMAGYITGVYFTYSLIYLISRSVAVSLIASQVHIASTFPATVLYDVPTQSYCNEVQRFLSQVHSDKVALSGLQFFTVTRGLLLTVAGTIVTYELVMFQITVPKAP